MVNYQWQDRFPHTRLCVTVGRDQFDSAPPRPLAAYLLGGLGFDALLALQRRLVYDIAGDRDSAALILCDHPTGITIGREGSDYVVCAGNLIEPSDINRLNARLSRIREMNKDELKAHYKEQLRAEPEAGSKGAGLGFMEIARRASKPLEFDFIDLGDGHAFFALKATI